MQVFICRNTTTGRLFATVPENETTVVLSNVDLSGKEYGVRLEGRQYGFMRDGSYGFASRLYVISSERIGRSDINYAWRGIINALGDHAEASPPIRAKYTIGDGTKTNHEIIETFDLDEGVNA